MTPTPSIGEQRSVETRFSRLDPRRSSAAFAGSRKDGRRFTVRRLDRAEGGDGGADFYPRIQRCLGACPDPIDFRAYTVVNIYSDTNAYYREGPFKRVARRPGQRNYLGHLSTTLEQSNHRELALGTRSRSGDQWDVWESAYSSVGADGYPKPIWNKLTGVIDRSVAEYWRENYDLSHILRRDWKTLGPKLRGKLRIYVGDMDNYYLTTPCIWLRNFLRSADPPAEACGLW